jgi:RNA 3'-terminal phosphate cyclase (ATP)
MLWLPFMLRLGCDARLSLEECGFYPQGGGRINATIRPAASLKPMLLGERRSLTHITGISAVANLDAHIAERQKRWAAGRLNAQFPHLRIQIDQLKSRFKGTMLLLYAEFASDSDDFPAAVCCCALGALGKPAERVADEAADNLLAFLASDGAVDPFLADQLLLPLSFARGESRFRTSRITRHLQTNADVINLFQAAWVSIEGSPGEPGLVRIIPAGL